MQEPNQELNEEGKPAFLAKMNTLGNISNAKEEVKKNSNAQKDKKKKSAYEDKSCGVDTE